MTAFASSFYSKGITDTRSTDDTGTKPHPLEKDPDSPAATVGLKCMQHAAAHVNVSHAWQQCIANLKPTIAALQGVSRTSKNIAIGGLSLLSAGFVALSRLAALTLMLCCRT